MSERKNLDKLFQEKFKDFEAVAPEQSWPYIEEQLKKKKKRRVIPFWWQLSGVAAALIIGFLIYKSWVGFSSGDQNSNAVVVNENTMPSQNKKLNPLNGGTSENAVSQNDTEKNETNPQNDLKNNTEKENQSNPHKPTQPLLKDNSEQSIASQESQKDEKSSVNGTLNPKLKPTDKHGYSTAGRQIAKADQPTGNSAKQQSVNSNTNKGSIGIRYQGDQLAVNVSGKRKGKHTQLKGNEPNQNQTTQNPIADQQVQTDKSSTINPGIVQQNKQNKAQKSVALTNKAADLINNTAIAAADIKPIKKIDSAAVATAVPNALEELLNEKENNLVTQGPHINRWQITSSVAPIYFGSTSGGSPIDSSFASNSKSYKTNMSVKLGVNYAVNKRLSIRTGISQVTLDYNTNDVMMYSGMQSRVLGNVNTSGESQFLHFSRRSSNENLVAASTELSTDKFQSYLNQRMGYIEVPLEVSYAVIDNKFGVNVIGGLSTLFLNENKILVVSDGLSTNLGEANNLSRTHFSTNIGLGLRYRFYKAFQANFEPMFKYQLNTFSKDNGNFKPYYLGLYTGVSYSF
jgi:hypothetical protein